MDTAIINRLKALELSHAAAQMRVGTEEVAHASALKELKTATEALEVVRGCAVELQNQAHKHISKIVTRCMHAIFGKRYEFKIIFELKRNKTEARLVFMKDGNEVDPMEAAEGGAIAVAAFALRIASLVLTRPHRRKCIFLDEAFSHLHKSHHHKVRALIKTLAKEMGIQIIIITHIEALKIGKIFNLGDV